MARISDTIADSGDSGGEDLLELLEGYNSRAQGHSDSMPDFSNLSDVQENPAEGLLLRGAHGPIELLEEAPVVDQELIRRCLRHHSQWPEDGFGEILNIRMAVGFDL